jgi:hypothetical protein
LRQKYSHFWHFFSHHFTILYTPCTILLLYLHIIACFCVLFYFCIFTLLLHYVVILHLHTLSRFINVIWMFFCCLCVFYFSMCFLVL